MNFCGFEQDQHQQYCCWIHPPPPSINSNTSKNHESTLPTDRLINDNDPQNRPNANKNSNKPTLRQKVSLSKINSKNKLNYHQSFTFKNNQTSHCQGQFTGLLKTPVHDSSEDNQSYREFRPKFEIQKFKEKNKPQQKFLNVNRKNNEEKVRLNYQQQRILYTPHINDKEISQYFSSYTPHNFRNSHNFYPHRAFMEQQFSRSQRKLIPPNPKIKLRQSIDQSSKMASFKNSITSQSESAFPKSNDGETSVIQNSVAYSINNLEKKGNTAMSMYDDSIASSQRGFITNKLSGEYRPLSQDDFYRKTLEKEKRVEESVIVMDFFNPSDKLRELIEKDLKNRNNY